jgi:hypothetical protein
MATICGSLRYMELLQNAYPVGHGDCEMTKNRVTGPLQTRSGKTGTPSQVLVTR